MSAERSPKTREDGTSQKAITDSQGHTPSTSTQMR